MYGTLSEAETYFANRLYTIAWDAALSTNKTIALNEATQRIDRLRFQGQKVDSSQELEFPRYYFELDGTDPEPDGTETVPNDIKIATYEVAFALLDGVNPDLELENLSVISQGYSNIRMSKSSADAPEHIVAGIPSTTAWRYLLPYLASSRTLRIHRVS